MKKMKFVTKGLVLLLMSAMLAGCGDSEPAKSSDDDKQQESSVDSKSSEADSKSSEADDQSSAVDASSSAVDDQSSAVDASSSEVQAGNNGDNADLIAKYEEYFKNYTFDGKKFSIDMTMEEEGMTISFKMEFGASNGDSMLYLGMPGQDGSNNSMTAYFMKDKSAYLALEISGQEPTVQKTTNMDQSVAEQMNPAGGIVDAAADGAAVDLVYVKEETIDGVLYDVVKPAGEDQEFFIYMNRATGEWELMKGEAEGQEIVAYILDMDPITIPASYANAEEIESDSFAMSLAFGMMGVMAGAGLGQ